MIKPEQMIGTPWGIAAALGFKLYPWQFDVLYDCVKRGATSLKACNESGKTTKIAAPLVLWNLTVFKNSTTVLTSGVFRQVKEQLFPAIRAHEDKFPGFIFNQTDITGPNGSKVVGFSTDKPGKFEGWHAQNHDKSPLLMIVDEAKSVADPIFEAIERCRPTRLLLMSSTGGCSGAFYRSFHDEAAFYRRHSVTAFDCPHIAKEDIDKSIAKYGENHPLVRSMIFSEFVDDADGRTLVITLAKVEHCLRNPPAKRSGSKVAFCDFGAGGDENVIAVREGNYIHPLICWRENDTMSAVAKFIIEFNRHGLSPDQIFCDEGGIGKPICDRLAEAGWRVNRVNNGETAFNDNYANRGAEMWFEACAQIEKCEVIIPNDEILKKQLSTRKIRLTGRGKLGLESKQDLTESPDRADAVVGAIACRPLEPISYTVETNRRWLSDEEDEFTEVEGAFAGI